MKLVVIRVKASLGLRRSSFCSSSEARRSLFLWVFLRPQVRCKARSGDLMAWWNCASRCHKGPGALWNSTRAKASVVTIAYSADFVASRDKIHIPWNSGYQVGF